MIQVMNSRPGCLRAAIALAFVLVALRAPAADVLVPAGSVWKYSPISSDVGTTWREFDFDDSSWAQGPAQLGYGDQDELTVVPFFYDPMGLKNISTYFRCSFTATNSARYTNLLVRLLRDDGAVIYLNGVELLRDNMPTGTITHATQALTSIFAPEEINVFVPRYASPAALREGANVLAVEIHQVAGTSADISFDLELIADTLPSLPPVIAFTAPPPGATFTPGADVTLEATAADPDGDIARVEFFAGSIKLGESTAAPFSFVWSNIPPGIHELTARATDNTGVTSNSAPVLIRAGGFSLVNTGAVWKYLDDQTDPGTAWREPAFDDSGWSSGAAQLGFGDGDEATLIRWKIAEVPIITAYFRRQFVCPDPANFSALMLRLLRDDGGVVYLNGVEVFRSNMPDGDINYTTYAQYSVGTGPEEGILYFPTHLPPALLVTGTNTFAVEIHHITQFSSTDLSFDCELTAFPTAAATHLTATLRGALLEVTWPAWTDRMSLQFTTSLTPPIEWTTVTDAAQSVAGQWTVLLPVGNDGPRYFRLRAE